MTVRDLAKRYGTIDVVRGLSFEVGEGEVFGLLGRNGAGKTTTLECVLGLRVPDEGEVVVAGIDARAAPERARARLGAQLQSAALADKLTPRQALAYFAAFYDDPLPAGDLLTRFGLVTRADAPFATLSGGERQRLFLALAVLHRPTVLVLDEPTASLDPQARRELHSCLEAARREGTAILLSTHDLDEAERLCDRVGILEGGRLVAVGSPAALLARCAARNRVTVRTAGAIDGSVLADLPGVDAIRPSGEDLEFTGAALAPLILAVTRRLTERGIGILDLRVQRPTLEDAFFEWTGRRWQEEDGR